MEKTMEHAMETGLIEGFSGFSLRGFGHHGPLGNPMELRFLSGCFGTSPPNKGPRSSLGPCRQMFTFRVKNLHF